MNSLLLAVTDFAMQQCHREEDLLAWGVMNALALEGLRPELRAAVRQQYLARRAILRARADAA